MGDQHYSPLPAASPPSVVMGYPLPPAGLPHDSPKTKTPHEDHSRSPKTNHSPKTKTEYQDPGDCGCIICMMFVLLFVGLLVLVLSQIQPPNFGVEYASVSLNSNNMSSKFAAAEWNIGFSVRNQGADMELKELSIYVTSLTGRTPVTILPGPYHFKSSERVVMNATIDGVLPNFSSNLAAIVLPFKFDFEAQFRFPSNRHNEVFERKARCSGMNIELYPPVFEGTLLEVPVPCELLNTSLSSYAHARKLGQDRIGGTPRSRTVLLIN